MISLRIKTFTQLISFGLLVSLCSCSTANNGNLRDVASNQTKQQCIDSVRPSYHNYFDSYEKCIEHSEKIEKREEK